MSHIDPELVVFDHNLSINDGAIRAGGWNFGDRGSWARAFIEALAKRYRFSLDTPFNELPEQDPKIILFGNGGEVLNIDTSNSKYSHGSTTTATGSASSPAWRNVMHETSSDDMKAYYEQFMSVTPCPVCHGARLKPEPAWPCGSADGISRIDAAADPPGP
jgi:excinuclease ABC subunit A